jgi:tetratricopeptide (TPR) repeat protein
MVNPVAAQAAIAPDPESSTRHRALGAACDFRGERDASIEAHARAIQLNPHTSHGLANVYHYGFGRLDEAARWWQRALAYLAVARVAG